MATASSVGAIIGQNWGAQRIGRVRQAISHGYRFCLGWCLFIAVVLRFVAQLASILNPEPNAIAIAAQYLCLVAISYGAAGILQVNSAAFNATDSINYHHQCTYDGMLDTSSLYRVSHCWSCWHFFCCYR
ncbi:MAG: hypothetical protein HRU34_03190 [Richelia sp.]|nr:hypothetical protein [Richelia sp.]